MQATATRPTLNPCRRLHRWIKSKILRARIAEMRQALRVLSECIAVDERLAANNRRQYLKSPCLIARLQADKALQLELAQELDDLTAELRGLL